MLVHPGKLVLISWYMVLSHLSCSIVNVTCLPCLIWFLLFRSSHSRIAGMTSNISFVFSFSMLIHKFVRTLLILSPVHETNCLHNFWAMGSVRKRWSRVFFPPDSQQQHQDTTGILHLFKLSFVGILPLITLHKKKIYLMR